MICDPESVSSSLVHLSSSTSLLFTRGPLPSLSLPLSLSGFLCLSLYIYMFVCSEFSVILRATQAHMPCESAAAARFEAISYMALGGLYMAVMLVTGVLPCAAYSLVVCSLLIDGERCSLAARDGPATRRVVRSCRIIAFLLCFLLSLSLS